MTTAFGPRKVTSTWPARFHEEGATLVCRVLKEPVEQQKVIDGKPVVFDDGKPQIQYIYLVQPITEPTCSATCHWCKTGTPRSGEDPGVRKIYANGTMNRVIQDAIYAVDEPKLYGRLVVKYVKDDVDKKQAGKAPPKVYAAAYKNPTDEDVIAAEKAVGPSKPAPANVQNGADANLWGLLEDNTTAGTNLSLEEIEALNKEEV